MRKRKHDRAAATADRQRRGLEPIADEGRYVVAVGCSMYPTMGHGDTLRFTDDRELPPKGTMISIRPAADQGGEYHLLKRLIAGPGDRVRYDANGVAVNGSRWRRKRTGWAKGTPGWVRGSGNRTYIETAPNGARFRTIDNPDDSAYHGEWSLGEGEFFVIGDHRPMSRDSRNDWQPGTEGAIREENLEPGEAMQIYRTGRDARTGTHSIRELRK